MVPQEHVVLPLQQAELPDRRCRAETEELAEPAQSHRKRLGVWVLLFLGVFMDQVSMLLLTLPFFLLMIVAIVLMSLFPGIATYLPQAMSG